MDIKKGVIAGAIIGVLGGGVYTGTLPVVPVDSVIQGEIVSKRTENSILFPTAKPNEFLARTYSNPVNYKAADGTFKTIDTTIQEKAFLNKAMSGYDKEVASGTYNAEFKAEKSWNYRFSRNGASVAFEALFDTTATVIITINPTTIGIKETVLLLSKVAPSTLQWKTVITGAKFENGSGWTVVNPQAQNAFYIPKLTAHDGQGNMIPVKCSWENDIITAEINTINAVFPIKIDPIAGTQLACNDAYTRSLDTTYNTARNANPWLSAFTDAYIYLGQNYVNSTYVMYRYFTGFYFDPNLNIGNVSAASLNLYIFLPPDSTFELEMQLSNQHGVPANSWSNKMFGWQVSGDYTPYMGPQYNCGYRNMIGGIYTFWTEIPFNARLDSLNAAIARADTFRLCLMSSNDMCDLAPLGNESLEFKGSLAASEYRPYLSITYTAKVPTGFTASAASTTTIACAWTDNIIGENGFRIAQLDSAGNFLAYIDSTAANATSKTISGLSVNTKYHLAVEVKGGTADGGISARDSCYTWANTPGAPTRSNPAADSTKIIINVNGNPAYTFFNVFATTTTPNETLWVNFALTPFALRTFGTVTEDSSWAWRNYAATGGASGFTMKTGIGKSYTWKTRAMSSE